MKTKLTRSEKVAVLKSVAKDSSMFLIIAAAMAYCVMAYTGAIYLLF